MYLKLTLKKKLVGVSWPLFYNFQSTTQCAILKGTIGWLCILNKVVICFLVEYAFALIILLLCIAKLVGQLKKFWAYNFWWCHGCGKHTLWTKNQNQSLSCTLLWPSVGSENVPLGQWEALKLEQNCMVAMLIDSRVFFI